MAACREGRFFMFCPVCCIIIVLWILSSIVINLLGKGEMLLCFVVYVSSVMVCSFFLVSMVGDIRDYSL